MLAATQASHGQKLLRYKFTAGHTERYAITQKMVQSVTTPQASVKITLTQTMDTRQKTVAVDADGTASVTQTVERVRMDMDLPQGRKVHYDSTAKEPPEGIAKAYATGVGGLVNRPIQIKLTPRGETRNIELPAEALAELKKAAGPAADAVGPENVTPLTNLAVFPEEPVAVGDTWKHQATMTNPVFGKLVIHTTYRYEGQESRQGRTLDKITSNVSLQVVERKAGLAPLDIKTQDGQGTIFFDTTSGRIVESTSTMRVKMAVGVAGLTMDQDMEMTTEVKLQPAETPPSAKP